jgi:hypothetical protein
MSETERDEMTREEKRREEKRREEKRKGVTGGGWQWYRSKDREAQVNEDSSLRNERHHLEEELHRMLDLWHGQIAMKGRRKRSSHLQEYCGRNIS